MDEFALIHRYFAPLTSAFPGALNLTDDAALIDVPPGMQLVASTDTIAHGVHFIGDEEPSLIARKLMRVNLSDLAAKGAAPLCYLLNIALPKETNEKFIADFASGLSYSQMEFGIQLAGGDTTATHGPAVFTLTVLGLVPHGAMLRRSGAKAGDLLFVSGTLGDSALGLMQLQGKLSGLNEHQEYLRRRYQLPQPRLQLGQNLRGIATACMDVSDGLVQDAAHLCATSKVGAQIHVSALPHSPAAHAALKADKTLMERLLAGGDDYELLFTVPASKDRAAHEAARQAGVEIHVIGRIADTPGVRALDDSGRDITPSIKGWRHFS